MKAKILLLGFTSVLLLFLCCGNEEGPTSPKAWYLYSDNDCAACTQQIWVDGTRVADIINGTGENFIGAYTGSHLIEIKKDCNGVVTTVCSQNVSPPSGYYVEADLGESCDDCEITWGPSPPDVQRNE